MQWKQQYEKKGMQWGRYKQKKKKACIRESHISRFIKKNLKLNSPVKLASSSLHQSCISPAPMASSSPLCQACALLQHVACTRSLHVGCASPATNSPVWLAAPPCMAKSPMGMAGSSVQQTRQFDWRFAWGLHVIYVQNNPLREIVYKWPHLGKNFIKVPHREQFAPIWHITIWR